MMNKARATLFLFLLLYCYVAPKAFASSAKAEALLLVDQRSYKQAAERLESLLQVSRDSNQIEESELTLQEIHHVLGYCYEKLKDWTKATEHYQEAVSPDYNLADYAIYRLATSYQQLEDDSNAIAWYQRLINEQPQNFRLAKAKFEIAKMYQKQEAYAKALDYLSGLIADKRSGYVRQATYEKAQVYEGLQDWQTALVTYQGVIDASASDKIAQNALERIQQLIKEHSDLKVTRSQRMTHGMVLYNRGKRTDAIKEFRKVTKGHKDALTGKATYYIGRSYHRQRKYDLAIKEYNKVVSRYPASDYLTRALYQTTLCYRRKEQPDIAQKRLKDFIQKYDWSAWADNASYDLGWVQENQKQYDEAIASYRLLTRKYRRSDLLSQAYWRIGWIQFKNKRYDDSIETFATLMKLHPKSRYAMAAHFWTAKCYERQEKPDAAKKTYYEVAAAKHWYYSGVAQAKLDQLKKESDVTKIAFAAPQPKAVSNSSVWKNIGSYRSPRVGKLMALKLYEDAVTELKGTIRSDRSSLKDSYYNLIVCYQKLERFEEAHRYAGKLSTFKSLRDENQTIPSELHQLLYPIYYSDIIEKYSKKYGLDSLFVAAMILEESHYGAEQISWAGAFGLMQIMPSTGRELATQLKIRRFRKNMLFQPDVNIHMGVSYMKYLMDLFENNYALVTGAYNGGPGRMKRWVKNMDVSDLDEFIEDIPLSETRRHIKKVINSYQIYQELYSLKPNQSSPDKL